MAMSKEALDAMCDKWKDERINQYTKTIEALRKNQNVLHSKIRDLREEIDRLTRKESGHG